MRYRSSDLFSCHRCGQCCKGYGGAFVTDSDVRAIAEHLKETPQDVVFKYCRRSGSRFILAQKSDGYCVFYDAGCRIHPVKPRMCKVWPFIESVLRDIGNWRIMAGFCPGINIDAPEAAIRARVEEELEHLRRISNPGKPEKRAYRHKATKTPRV